MYLLMHTSQCICNITCRGKIRYIIHKKIYNSVHKLRISYFINVAKSELKRKALEPVIYIVLFACMKSIHCLFKILAHLHLINKYEIIFTCNIVCIDIIIESTIGHQVFILWKVKIYLYDIALRIFRFDICSKFK